MAARVLGLCGTLALLAAAPAARGQGLYTWGLNGEGEIGDGTTTDRAAPVRITGFTFGVDATSGGGFHGLAIRNGAAFAWGGNPRGELGDGTTVQRNAPVAVGGGLTNGVTAIAAGYFFSVAVRNGAVYAWGFNDEGQLGDGTFANRSMPTPVLGLTAAVTAISAGYQHGLAVRDGAAYAWGYNEYGQLGDDTAANRPTPVAVGGAVGAGVTAVSAGFHHSLAVRDGALYGWGYNAQGQLGNNTTQNTAVPGVVSVLASGVSAVAAGDYYTLAVRNGVAFAWGYNVAGQLGDGTRVQRNAPVAVTGLPATGGVVRVAAGAFTSFALTADHRLFAWGDNSGGQFGNGGTASSIIPVEVFAPTGFYFAALDAGSGHATASLMPNAAGVFASGLNGFGQIGDGTTVPRTGPTAATGLTAGINTFSGGGSHTLSVRNGAVYASGRNDAGQLGDGTTANRSTPVLIGGVLANAVLAVSAGSNHSLAIRNGAAYAWGDNSTGQVGDGSTAPRTAPVAIASLASGVSAVAAGNGFSLAIRDGAVFSWGNNANGQLGDGSTAQRTSPVPIATLASGVSAISTGATHGVAIRNGAAFAWGNNANGQLGDGTTATRTAPVSVGGLLTNGVSAVSAGGSFNLAIRNGLAYAWGANARGQLGDGTGLDRSTPVPVTGLPATGILQVAAGADHGLALTTDHRLFAWGNNDNGQFGNGGTVSSLTPVEVFAPGGMYFVSVEAGEGYSVFFVAPLAIPEPATVLGFATGVYGLARLRFRRRMVS